MAEVLEHADPGPQPEIPRAWAPQVLATGDHGRSHLLRAEGGTVLVPGCSKIRYTVPDIRAVRQQSPQYARPKR